MAQWVVIVAKLKKWVLFLTCTAFLFIVSISVRAYSYEMYDINNLLANSQYCEITDYAYSNNFCGEIPTPLYKNHIYYISRDYEYIKGDKTNATAAIVSLSGGAFYFIPASTSEIHHYSAIKTYTLDSSTTYLYYYGTINTTGINSIFSNIILIDLTQTFGYGNEPSLSDFETLYLANIPEYQNTGWFSSYSSYKPESYITIDQNDYSDLGEDLTGVDYTKSVISNYGDNINIDMYAYIDSHDSLTYDTFNIAWYIDNNFPELKYLGNTYNLVWEQVDYSDHVIHLVMSDIEQDIFKRILFNRFIEQDNEYFKLEIECTPLTDISMWFEISTAFNLKVGIKSLLLARNTVTDNDFNMVNALYYKFIDISGDLMLPALKVNIGDISKNTFINDFGSQYSDVSEFIIAFDIASPPLGSTYELETHYIYELGLFSSNNVFIPTMPTSSELEAMFPNDICDWYQFGCQASNIINNIGETLYVKLNIPAIVAVFSGIIASISNIVAITPEPVAIIIYIVLGAVSTGLILLLVERIL